MILKQLVDKRLVGIFTVLIVLLSPIDVWANNLVTATFIDTDIRQAIYEISTQTGVPIILDSTVEGFVTLELKDTPLEKALDMVTSQGGYVYSKKDGYYLIGSPDVKNVTFNNLSKTYFYKPRYVTVDLIKEKIDESLYPFIKLESSLNLISITAPESMIDRIVKKIKVIDIPKRSIFVDILYVKRSYKEIKKMIPEDWSIQWNLEGKMGESNIGSYFKDLKLGFIYNNAVGLDGIMDILKSKSDTVQTARFKFVIIEGENSSIFLEEKTYRQLVIENYIATVPFSADIEMSISPKRVEDKINIDLYLISSYVDGELRKSTGSSKTSVLLGQDKITVLGGIVDYRDILERFGVFAPYIPAEEEKEDSFTIFLYAKEIPRDLEGKVLSIMESGLYSLSKLPVKKKKQEGLVISGNSITIVDLLLDNLGKTTIRSGLDVNGSFPLGENTATVDGIYLEGGLKSLALGLNTNFIGEIDMGISYRLARDNNLSIDSLQVFLEEETYPYSSLTLNGRLLAFIMKDNITNKVVSDIGIDVSANYRISESGTLKLEYLRSVNPNILSSLRLELETKISKSLSIALGYDTRESLYKDNIISNSYGRGIYIKLNYNF